jgi:hypothetical protein
MDEFRPLKSSDNDDAAGAGDQPAGDATGGGSLLSRVLAWSLRIVAWAAASSSGLFQVRSRRPLPAPRVTDRRTRTVRRRSGRRASGPWQPGPPRPPQRSPTCSTADSPALPQRVRGRGSDSHLRLPPWPAARARRRRRLSRTRPPSDPPRRHRRRHRQKRPCPLTLLRLQCKSSSTGRDCLRKRHGLPSSLPRPSPRLCG